MRVDNVIYRLRYPTLVMNEVVADVEGVNKEVAKALGDTVRLGIGMAAPKPLKLSLYVIPAATPVSLRMGMRDRHDSGH